MSQSISRLAGMLCNNKGFQAFLNVEDSDSAAKRLRELCNVESRRELDSNAEAAKRFQQIRRTFAYGEDDA